MSQASSQLDADAWCKWTLTDNPVSKQSTDLTCPVITQVLMNISKALGPRLGSKDDTKCDTRFVIWGIVTNSSTMAVVSIRSDSRLAINSSSRVSPFPNFTKLFFSFSLSSGSIVLLWFKKNWSPDLNVLSLTNTDLDQDLDKKGDCAIPDLC